MSKGLTDEPNGWGRVGCRLACVPILLLLVIMVVAWVAGVRTNYEAPYLQMALNFLTRTLACALVVWLTGRNFLIEGRPGLLLLGCGVMIWGASGFLATALVTSDPNLGVTISNLGVWLSALCHLAGVILSLRSRRRVRAVARWLSAGYLLALGAVALVTQATFAGWLPVFFIDGQGGTLVRHVALGSALGMFLFTAVLLREGSRASDSSFARWYALALLVIAIGVFGMLLQSSRGSLLNWTCRAAQYLGGIYMFIAAVVSWRESRGRGLALVPSGQAWPAETLLGRLWQPAPSGWARRYAWAAVGVAIALGLRQGVAAWFGPGFPPYLMFGPALMVVALLGGLGPGLVATALACLATGYWILAPAGQFAIAAPVDRLGLVLFAGAGVFVSVVAELYRRDRHKAAAYDREAAVRASRAQMAAFAEATFEGILESEAERVMDCNEQLARMLGYTVAELRGAAIGSLIAPEDRERVLGNLRDGRGSVLEHGMLCKDGTRIMVEVHGRPIPGGARRHTAIRDITKRKQVEEALRASESVKQAILDSLPAHLAVLDERGIVTAVNASWQRFARENEPADPGKLGVGVDYLGACRKAKDMADPMAREALEGIEAVLSGRQSSFTLEYPCHSPTQDRWFLMNVVRPAGGVRGAVVTHLDITERQQAEAALQNTLQRFYHVLSSMYSGVLLMTEEGRVEFVNQAFCDAYGLKVTPAELAGCSSADLLQKILPAFQEPAESAVRIRVILQAKQPVRVEEFAMQGGRTALRDYVPLSIDGKSCGRLWIYTDISQRKRAEEALRQSGERLELALASSRMATFDWDILQDKRTWSAGVHRLLGTQPATFTGTAAEFFQVIHPEDRPAVQAALARAVQRSDTYETEYRVVWPDGSIRHISARGNVQRDGQGRAVMMTGVCWDITESKAAETALQRRAEELRAANEELTRFNRITVGRELRIVELKAQINALCARLGQPARYRADPGQIAEPTP